MSDHQDLDTLAEQGQHVAHNMAEVFDISSQIWQTFMAAQLQQGTPKHADPLNTFPTFAELYRTMWDNPKEVADKTIQYWTQQSALWQHSMLRWLGAKDVPEKLELPHMMKADRRFAHKEWSENAVFDYVKQSYLLTSGWIQDTVNSVGEMDPKERKKAAFYTRQFVEAMNPANFFALNPEVLEATVSEKGDNLVRGLKMMLKDLERGKGKLLIRQTDMDAFEVGKNTAVSEGSVIWQTDICQLIQYSPKTEKVCAKPILIIPPWINKYYVLDLNPKKSLVKWLVEQGHTVFMISWVNPDARHKEKTWESYMFEGASAAIDKVLEETGQRSTHVASYCIGGTLTGTLLAWMGKNNDKRVASATFFTAQLDFEDAGELQILVDDQTINVIDSEMEQGYMPANKMAEAFNMLRANDLIWGYVVNNYMLGKDPFPFDLLFWNADSTAMPAKVHGFYLQQFYVNDAFAKGNLVVDNTNVTLADIKVPVYHVATKEDHIAPAASVYRGAKEMTNADVRFVLSGSGHIAGVVNPPALGKYQFWTNADMSQQSLDAWMGGTQETEGSWWPDWDEWLKARSGRQLNAREPGAKLGVIEPAPGSYVKVRFDKQ
ncbi:MAG: class I poly(R)-hydroxyalkanoic acid synthase [Rhodobacteraceae bacterium]|uniref:PHA/PHB synthase family protein n=1 Tax=Amaricoccus sp. B4 TaxID=3368557 RepID=UPI0013A6A0CA|nr:class I poly(R)-hydroxyalkanoic acid synthase [Paracoccaceae bacterium]